MLPVVQIGPLAIQVPGLVLLAGLWIGLSLAERHAKQFGVEPEKIYNLTLVTLAAGALGARLTYALRYPETFRASPWSLVSLNPGLLDPIGGLTIALLAGLVYGQRKKMPLWPTLDAITPALAVMGIAIGLANLASGKGFGAASNLPWAVNLWGESRHPSQIYEILAASLILWIVWPSPRKDKKPSGLLFLQFLTLSAGTRVFLEAFRGDSTILFNSVRAAQASAWLVLAIGLWGIGRLQRRKSD